MSATPTVPSIRWVALCVLWVAGAAQAEVDPLLAGLEPEDETSDAHWHAFGDFAARAESTTGFDNRDDIERLRSRLRLGLRRESEDWLFAIAGKAGLGSDDNRDNVRNLDNEKSNGIGLDEAWIAWQSDSDTRFSLGKAALTLATTPLTWDTDLRPVGAWLDLSRPSGDFNRWTFTLGHYAPDHLYGDDSRLSAAQLGWHYQEGAPFSAEARIAWWHYADLDGLVARGLARSNRSRGGQLLSDFHLLNLQFATTWLLEEQPLALRLDLVDNRGAVRDARGARFSAVYGSALQPQGWEWAVAYQRIGRDAVPAAFNADDWWFHSAARGVMPWVGYGINATWSLQLSGFYERLDGQDEYITRILLDLRARW